MQANTHAFSVIGGGQAKLLNYTKFIGVISEIDFLAHSISSSLDNCA